MNVIDSIEQIQALVGATVDGKFGPDTANRVLLRLGGKFAGTIATTQAPPVGSVDRVSSRSEAAIATLLPQVQPYARALIHAAAKQDITIEVTSATRTYDEQDQLFKQGRSLPGKIVTNARGGQSNHNFGVAFDVTIFQSGEPVWESPAYKAIGALGQSLGLVWGGSWTSINDEPHFELHPKWSDGLTESQFLQSLRERKAGGTPIFA